MELCEAREARPGRLSDTYRWQKQWRVERDRGLKRTTSPQRAQVHVQSLTATYGMSIRSIAEASGTAPGLISELNRGICNGLRVTTEQSILAVKADDIYARPNTKGSVPNIGARRRLQALMVMGWRHQDLSPRLGFSSANVIHQNGSWISQRKHEAVKDLYERLWNQRGPAGAASLGRVAKAGYVPPLAWDDESIDDPNAEPDDLAPRSTYRKSDVVVEDVEFLLDDGYCWPALPGRLGTNADALERALHRAGRADLINRAKTMTERLAHARAS